MMLRFPLLELPLELCLHVLTRLPLKYLMRLRCVSKFFLDLTNNPNFITSYRKSNPPPPPLPPRMIVPIEDFNPMRLSPSLFSRFYDKVGLDFNLPTSYRKSNPPSPLPPRIILHKNINFIARPNLEEYHDFNFMETSPPPPPSGSLCHSSKSKSNQWPWRFHMLFKGSSFIYLQKRHELIPFHCPNTMRFINCINGLICFGETNSLEIYNIFAGTNYYLIPPNFNPPSWDPIFVFGYDPISNDYKILIIETSLSWLIYSFANNSWKSMNLEWDHCTIYSNSEGGRSVCINGVIYWPPTRRRDFPCYDKIVLFDLHNEKFGVIQLPKEDLLLPTQYAGIQLLSFRGCLAFAFINKKRTSATATTTTRKRMRSGERGDEREGEKATSHGGGEGEIWVELFRLNLSKTGKSVWNRKSFAVPIPSPTKEEEVEIVSCCDEVFLGWFQSNQLRLYNLHTKHIFNLPLSPPSHYYPKTSFTEKKKKENGNPTYVDNLSFDFSLISNLY